MTLKPDMSIQLRGMVRDVLREVMAGRSQQGLAAVESVRIANDLDLAAFVSRITEPAALERIKSGNLRFTLAETAAAASLPGHADVLTGVITEQKLNRLAGIGTLVLGPGAVLTPLARDKARQLGLKIERRR